MSKVIQCIDLAVSHFCTRAIVCTIFGLIPLLSSGTPSADGTTLSAGHIIVTSRSGLPTGGSSWSLFLVCNPSWLASNRSADLKDLFDRFKAFGDAIGKHNHAIWFSKRGIFGATDRIDAKDVDIERNANYCRSLSLRPSQGPYVVVFDVLPEIDSLPKDRAIFSLGKLTALELENVLDRLTDALVLVNSRAVGGIPMMMRTAERGAQSASSPSHGGEGLTPMPPVWIQLLESTRAVMRTTACRFSLQVKAGALSAEMKACK